MLPLSFQEFIDFHGFTIKETINALGNKKRYVYDSKGDRYELNELFQAYMRYGGMPGIVDVGLEQERVLNIIGWHLFNGYSERYFRKRNFKKSKKNN